VSWSEKIRDWSLAKKDNHLAQWILSFSKQTAAQTILLVPVWPSHPEHRSIEL
jgi:hypothetical protein